MLNLAIILTLQDDPEAARRAAQVAMTLLKAPPQLELAAAFMALGYALTLSGLQEEASRALDWGAI